MNSKKRLLGITAVAGIGLLASGTAVFSAVTGNDNNQKPPLNLKYDSQPINREAVESHLFAPIVQKVTPSVVQGYVITKSGGQGNFADQQDPQDSLRPFFRRQFPQHPEQPQNPTEKDLG